MRRSKKLLAARRALETFRIIELKHSCEGVPCDGCPVEVLRQEEDWLPYIDVCSVSQHQNKAPGTLDRTEKAFCRLKEKLEDEVAKIEMEEAICPRS